MLSDKAAVKELCDPGKTVCKDKWINVESKVSTSEHRKRKKENML